MAMTSSDILFTRQKHDADRAGLHYDIRLVQGDKAYSWATKKEMPEVGGAIMLYEQPVHTKDYAMRQRIVIPKGNYGSGTTVLDFVRKAKVTKNEEKGHYVLESSQGERYLLKPMTTIPGGKSWLFKRLPDVSAETKNKYLEKAASFLVGAGLSHLAQNAVTNAGLKTKFVAKHLADKFATGYAGKVESGIGNKIKNSVMSVVSPDLHIAGKTLSEMGNKAKELSKGLNKRDLVGLRMLSQGRFADIHKYGLNHRPGFASTAQSISNAANLKIDVKKLLSKDKAEELHKVWTDKKFPLLSNISQNITKGKISAKSAVGKVTSTNAIASNIGAAAIDAGGAAVNLSKHLASSAVVQKTRIGKAVSDKIQHVFVNNPLKKGWESMGSAKDGIKSKLYEHLINPTSAHLKRTSSAISSIVNKD